MKLALFPLDLVLFPQAVISLHIFEDRYKEMIGECIARENVFGIVRGRREGLACIGCTAKIIRVLQKYPDGCMDILCCGVNRFEIESLDNSRSFLQAEVDLFEDAGVSATRGQREQCTALHFEALDLIDGESTEIGLDLNLPIAFQLAWSAPSDLDFKQELLAMRCDSTRTEKLLDFYSDLLPKLRRGVRAGSAAGAKLHVM